MEEHFLGKVATKAVITKDEKVLMGRDRRDADIWDLPGGRINVGESLASALEREVKEELGVDVRANELIYSEQIIHTSAGDPHLFVTMKASLIDPDQKFQMPTEELAEIRWIGKGDLAKIKTYDNCIRALKAYWKLP